MKLTRKSSGCTASLPCWSKPDLLHLKTQPCHLEISVSRAVHHRPPAVQAGGSSQIPGNNLEAHYKHTKFLDKSQQAECTAVILSALLCHRELQAAHWKINITVSSLHCRACCSQPWNSYSYGGESAIANVQPKRSASQAALMLTAQP